MNNTCVWHDIDDYVKIEASFEQEQEQIQQQVHVQDQEASISHDIPRREQETPQCRKKDESSKSSREIQPPIRYKYYELMSHVMNVVELSSYEEAKEFKEQRDAMNEEYSSIMKNDTWELTKLPKDKVPIG